MEMLRQEPILIVKNVLVKLQELLGNILVKKTSIETGETPQISMHCVLLPLI